MFFLCRKASKWCLSDACLLALSASERGCFLFLWLLEILPCIDHSRGLVGIFLSVSIHLTHAQTSMCLPLMVWTMRRPPNQTDAPSSFLLLPAVCQSFHSINSSSCRREWNMFAIFSSRCLFMLHVTAAGGETPVSWNQLCSHGSSRSTTLIRIN